MSLLPGWYPDPFSSGGYVRWWDGQRWGPSQVAPEVGAPPLAAPAGSPPQPPPAPAVPSAPPPPPGPYTGRYGDPYGAPTQPGAGYGQAYAAYPSFPLASWGSRAVAKLLDVLVESVVIAPVVVWMLWPAFQELSDAVPADGTPVSDAAITRFQDQVVGASVALSIVALAVTFLYEVPQNALWGRTLGMRALGIRIRPLAEDRRLTWGQATIRWGTYALPALLAGLLWTLLDYLWPLWDKPWRQALHDKTARTIVVPTR